MKKLLLLLLCVPMIGVGQQTYVPDDNFESYLEANGMGDGIQLNDSINTLSIEMLIYLDVGNQNISNLTGIKDFTALIKLYCNDNQLTSLDVSNNTALTGLYCTRNPLTSLDVSTNTALTDLACQNNLLTKLDVSTNTGLQYLNCQENQLTNLDVSNNTALVYFFCSMNQLISLDLRNGNNNNMLWWDSGSPIPGISVSNNPYLNCINVDDSSYCNSNWLSEMDPQHYFSNNCSGTTDIEEHTTNKELIKITDILGRETKQTNQPLFYIYNDGTVEKKIIIE